MKPSVRKLTFKKQLLGSRPSQITLASTGVGLLWGPMALRAVANYTQSEGGAGIISQSDLLFSNVIEILACAILLAFASHLVNPSAKKTLAWAGIVTTGAVMSLGLFVPAITSDGPLSTFYALLLGLSSIIPLILWGLYFAEISRENVMQIMVWGSVVGAITYLIFACMPDNQVRWIAQKCLLIVSLALFLPLAPHSINASSVLFASTSFPNRLPAANFLLEQFFLCACFGALVGLSNSFRTGSSPNSAIAAACTAALLAVAFTSRQRITNVDSIVAPLIPMLSCLLIAMPFFSVDIFYSAMAMPAIACIAWLTCTFALLPDRRRDTNISTGRLVLLTMLVARLSCIGTRAAVELPLVQEAIVRLDAATILLLMAVITITVVIFVTFKFISFNHRLLGEQIAREVAKAEENNVTLSIQRIAQAYDLTPREQEVCALLAKGYTRSDIAEKLCISEGTSRTHISNIYRKTGCSSKSELIALAEHPDRISSGRIK